MITKDELQQKRSPEELDEFVQSTFESIRADDKTKKNSIKMYDKWNILRIETTINNPRGFKIYREVKRNGERVMRWVSMGKSVYN